MADRRQIEAMIKKKEQEIQEIEQILKEARVYVQALQDVLKKFPRKAGDATDPNSVLRPGSLVARAREAILRRGAPMHVEQILSDMGREPDRSNKTALGGSISAYVRKGIIFTRTGPNTFGLVELEDRAPISPEPPPDFGVEKASPDLDEEIPF